MKKTLDYIYIFSKLSISFILLFIIFLLGYFFYLSFKNQETSNNDQSEIINKLNENAKKLTILSKKIEITDNSLEEIKTSIQKSINPDESVEVVLLKKKIEEINKSLKNITFNLEKIKTTTASESDKISPDSILNTVSEENKKEIIRLIIYKFENNLDFTEELDILQNFESKNQYIFEKINLVRLKNFRGNVFLKDIFSQELDLFLKEKFNKKSSNFFLKSLMNFVGVEPSKMNTIKNNETLVLKEISTLLEEKNYKMSYEKIITIKNYQTHFTKTVKQIQIANDFKDLINKTI